MERKIRNSCKAIVIEGGKLLIIKKEDSGGVYYTLPGGGQHFEETFHQTLTRECKEELGVESIGIHDLLFIREYIGKEYDPPLGKKGVHQVEFIFHCKLLGMMDESLIEPDSGQIGVDWIDIGKMDELPFYPKGLIKAIQKYGKTRVIEKIYWGSMN